MQYIPMDNITKMNELIYAGAKLDNNKICILLRNLNRNAKPRWKLRLEGQNKETATSKNTKVGKSCRNLTKRKVPWQTTADKFENTTGRK